jgi:hypothetical protein
MGVKESTAYFWMKRARASAAPAFARVVPARAANATVAIEVGAAIVRVEPGFDAALLLQVVSVLSEQRS